MDLTKEEQAHLEQRCKELLLPLRAFVKSRLAEAPVPPSKLIGLGAEIAPGVLDVVVCERQYALREVDVLDDAGMERVVLGAIAEEDHDDWLRFVLFIREGTVSTALYLRSSGYLGEA
jgi:hypothetical protein